MDTLAHIGNIIEMCNDRENGDYNREDGFYVGDLDELESKCNLWKQNMPRVHAFYAMKANPDLQVVTTMIHQGMGLDVSSIMELKDAVEMDVPRSNIIYANTVKYPSHLEYAAQQGIDLMTFDNEAELIKIKQVFPTARLVIRILPSATDKALIRLDKKAGCSETRATQLLLLAKTLEMNVVGVSFHTGSGCTDPTVYADTIYLAKTVFQEAKDIGFNFNLLDIGGGFHGVDEDGYIPFQNVCAIINSALDSHFPPSMGVRIIAEPGRFLVTSAFSMSVKVIGITQISDSTNGQLPKRMYFVTGGCHGAFRGKLYDKGGPCLSQPIVLNKQKRKQMTYEATIVGPTCDAMDCIMESCRLPDLDMSDWLVFRDMGAYTVSFCSEFNGFPKPRIYYIGQNVGKP